MKKKKLMVCLFLGLVSFSALFWLKIPVFSREVLVCPCGEECETIHYKCSNIYNENCSCPCPEVTATPGPTVALHNCCIGPNCAIGICEVPVDQCQTGADCVTPSSPTPTVTAVLPSSTPAVPPQCSCLSLSLDQPDLNAVKKGKTLEFTAKAYVQPAQTAEVISMIYVLSRDGQEMLRSGEIPAKLTGGVYQTFWTNMPEVAGLYHLQLDINCGWKNQSQVSFSVLGKTQSSALSLNPVLVFLKNFFSFFGVRRQSRPQIQEDSLSPAPLTTTTPAEKSLKLDTFEFLPPAKDCTELYFRVVD